MPIVVVLCAQRPCEQPVDMAGENMSLEALFSPLKNDGFLLGWHLMVVIFSFVREELPVTDCYQEVNWWPTKLELHWALGRKPYVCMWG